MTAPSTPALITTATDEEVHSGELGRRIRTFNYGFVGEYGQAQTIHLNAKGDGGVLLGGIRSYVFLEWLQVDILFVAEAARGHGLGARILAEAENRARELGARGVFLNTFDWQAEGFYLKQGYVRYGRVEDYFKGFGLAMMRKIF
jgi:GNAT superfamily N-acetyltransferase